MARALSAFLLVFSMLGLIVHLTQFSEILALAGAAIFVLDSTWAYLLSETQPGIDRQTIR